MGKLLVVLMTLCLIPLPSAAGVFDKIGGGGSFDAIPLKCSEATIVSKRDLTGPSMADSGLEVFSNGAEVTVKPYGNRVFEMTQVHDRVQVCLLAIPQKTDTCNPNIDKRGRLYYIYDYRIGGAYTETTGEHSCGGA